MGRKKQKKLRRWVVKVGSQMVNSGGALLIRAWMEQLVKLRREHGVEVIWVSSGAISSAVTRTDFSKTKSDWRLSEKQALSAIGQPLLMDLYNLAIRATGQLGAQVLLTANDLSAKDRRRNFQQTIEQLLGWNVVPILNENDAIATEEIKFGDNDSLSAKVAVCIDAERLVILTDVEGLYSGDPRTDPQAQLIARVPRVTPAVLATAGAAGSKHGTGGMYSKMNAAGVAAKGGIQTCLVKGDAPSILIQVAQNNFRGTVIEAPRKKRTR